MPLFDQFGQPIQAAKPRFKKKARPKNIPRKRRPFELGALHRQAVRDVTVTLLARHNVNGMTYGPGQVTVKRDLADALNEAERNARQADENFAGTRAMVVGPGRQGGFVTRRVAPEYFDAALANAIPLGQISA